MSADVSWRLGGLGVRKSCGGVRVEGWVWFTPRTPSRQEEELIPAFFVALWLRVSQIFRQSICTNVRFSQRSHEDGNLLKKGVLSLIGVIKYLIGADFCSFGVMSHLKSF